MEVYITSDMIQKLSQAWLDGKIDTKTLTTFIWYWNNNVPVTDPNLIQILYDLGIIAKVTDFKAWYLQLLKYSDGHAELFNCVYANDSGSNYEISFATDVSYPGSSAKLTLLAGADPSSLKPVGSMIATIMYPAFKARLSDFGVSNTNTLISAGYKPYYNPYLEPSPTGQMYIQVEVECQGITKTTEALLIDIFGVPGPTVTVSKVELTRNNQTTNSIILGEQLSAYRLLIYYTASTAPVNVTVTVTAGKVSTQLNVTLTNTSGYYTLQLYPTFPYITTDDFITASGASGQLTICADMKVV